MSGLVELCFGVEKKFNIGEPVLICTVDGCMAEYLTVHKEGKIVKRIKVPVINADAIDGIRIQYDDGSTSDELLERLKRLNDGRLVVAN